MHNKIAMQSKQFRWEIEQVRRPLAAWRRTRRHREPIPEALWRAMVGLARTYGISAVSRALRVGYYGLKRRVAEIPAAALIAPTGPAFVELKPLPSCSGAGCTRELEEPCGAKMTLHFEPGNGVDTLALAQAFWRRSA